MGKEPACIRLLGGRRSSFLPSRRSRICAAAASPTGWCSLSCLRESPSPAGFTAGTGSGKASAGMGLGALLFGVLCWMGGMGMGDVKLVCRHRRLDRAGAVADSRWSSRGSPGASWPSAGPLPVDFLASCSRARAIWSSGFGKRGLASPSGTGSRQSPDAQNALCSGHRDRDHLSPSFLVED